MWNQYGPLKPKIPFFKVNSSCRILALYLLKQLHWSYWTRRQQLMHGPVHVCHSGCAEMDGLWFIKVKKVSYLLSLSHTASCSNTLKILRADFLSKASMLSYFKCQWNIMTQNGDDLKSSVYFSDLQS